MEKFSTSFKGYKKEEVNKFLNDVIRQVEGMISDLKSRDAEIENLKKSLEHYKDMESTFNRAIMAADEATSQMKRLARDESNTIINEARKNASRIVNEALMESEKTQYKTEQLKRNIITFKRRLRGIIENQLEMVDDIDHLDI